jgi:hypothetical protein
MRGRYKNLKYVLLLLQIFNQNYPMYPFFTQITK